MTENIIIKKDTSKVYVISSSPRELISVQIINLDFRLKKKGKKKYLDIAVGTFA